MTANTAAPYSRGALVSFVETKLFSRLVGEYLSEDEYRAVQSALVTRPTLGVVVPGSGGVRKLRWARSGRGKRGGVRVMCYVHDAEATIWMLTLYAKNEAATIPAHVLRRIKDEIDG